MFNVFDKTGGRINCVHTVGSRSRRHNEQNKIENLIIKKIRSRNRKISITNK